MTARTNRQITRKCCICQEKREDCLWYGSLKDFVCSQCTLSRQSYTLANAVVVGVPLKWFPAFSLEFEVSSYDRGSLDQALILLKYQYKRTSDSSVDDEYKSPIYHSIRAFRKPLAILHDLRGLVNERCGTHLHVAYARKEDLRAIHSEVFSPLLDHMLHHPEQTIQFWGRFFSRYATAPNSDRYHCFNLESRYPTLEFRLPRFRTAEQYLRVVRYCRAIVALLNNALGEDQQTDTSAHSLSDQHEKEHKRHAMSPGVLGKRVLALYMQYVKELPEHETWLDEEEDPDDDQNDDEELVDWDDF